MSHDGAMKVSKTVSGMIGASGLLAAYLAWIRPWQLRWGASDAEAAMAMPGDHWLPAPSFDATRAVEIDAPPEEIWPWITQMGAGRAGWYSYDWIDNLGRESARIIHPEWRVEAAGDQVPMAAFLWFVVEEIDAPRYTVWRSSDSSATWTWALYPLQGGRTRLLSRMRIKYEWTSPKILFHLAADVGDFLMMRKCMLGIKERAEAMR